MSPDEGLLRDVLGVLPVPDYAVGHPERQGRALRQPLFELLLEGSVHGYETAHQAVRMRVHRVTRQDAARRGLVR